MRGILACTILAAMVGGCEQNPGAPEDSSGDVGATEGTGSSGGTTDGEEAAACVGIDPGPSPIRRLTRREYNNTVRDLLGDDSEPANAFPAEEEALGFNNNADALVVTQLLAEGYLQAAETLAEKAVADLPKLMKGCDVGAEGEDACARRFITEFGARAYRRPLTEDEVEALFDLYDGARGDFDFLTGIRLTLTTILQSPHFLYRVEFGEPAAPGSDVVKVAPYELASRLSYFLWGTMPDDELLAAAAEGRLETADDVAGQAARMLNDVRAREIVRDFHRQWLQLGLIEEIEKDPEVFPEFDPEIRPQLRAQAETLIDHVVWNGQGDIDTMLTAPYTFLNGALSKYYGIKGPSGDALQKFELPEGQAAGILTQGGLLAVLAKPNQTSPIHRGKFVRERLMCQMMPPPPDDVDITPPEVDPSLPTRERYKQHSIDPACGGCHQLMDPIGFGFEHYDALGRWRDEEAGQPIDASGEIAGAKDGAFDGVPDLAAMLVETEALGRCVTVQWFRYTQGRAESKSDACTLDGLAAEFAASGRRIPDLLVALTQTDAFLYRRAPKGAGGKP